MPELLGVLQEIVQENQKAMKPTDLVFGTVVSAAPVSVQADGAAQPIPAAALVLTDAVVARSAPVEGGEGGTVVIHAGLQAGDKVVMLRVQRGQRYIILSKTQ